MRAIAYKMSIGDVNKGEFIPSPGGYEPAYIQLGGRQFSRVNVVGTLVKDNVLDDGTDEIELRDFNNVMKAKEGNVVRVIGKVREQEGTRYVAVEACRKVDVDYLKLRALELEKESVPLKEAPMQEEKPVTRKSDDITLEIEELDI